MKVMLGLLSCLAVLACVGGCIPIGIRGSTMAGAEAPSCVAQPHLDARARDTGPGPIGGAATTDEIPDAGRDALRLTRLPRDVSGA